MSNKSITFYIKDMVCTSCQDKIENEIKKINGVISVKASYKKGEVYIKFNSSTCNTLKIINAIKKSGYSINESNTSSKISEVIAIVVLIVIALFIVLSSQNSGSLSILSSLSNEVSYGILFVIGLLSSLHCIGMCGGIMLSQSLTIKSNSKIQNLKPSLLYNLGRVASYTILGGIVGGLGNVFSISTTMRASISILAGIFMVIMGLNISGFKALRRFSIKLPWSSCKTSNRNRSPFIVGLLNGFMPCGPLQAMQLYALASGSILNGALSMFFFSLGTIPLMLLFAVISTLLTTKGTKSLLKVSGVIVLVLGVSMANRGFTLLGINLIPQNEFASDTDSDNFAVIDDGEQIVNMSVIASGYSPKTLYVQKGVKTKLIIEGNTLTSCNNEIIFPTLDIRKKLSPGENIIEFTPTDSAINFSCWMGMVSGKIKVVDDINVLSQGDGSNQNAIIEESIKDVPIINDLSKVENLKTLKIDKDKKSILIPFTEVVSLIGSEGKIVYPDENDESVKIMYWIYKKDNIKYFLDATFYMDKLVNVESPIVLPSDIVDISSKVLSDNYKTELESIKSYSKIKEILGEGSLAMNYFIPSNDRIYIWKYKDEYISAYVTQEDSVILVEVSSDLELLIQSTTNIH